MAMAQRGIRINFSTKRNYFEKTDLVDGEVKLGHCKKRFRKHEVFAPLSTNQIEKLEDFKRGRYADATNGIVAVLVDRKARQIMWSNFNPFGILHEQAPKQIGIGASIHHVVTEYLARRFPNYTITHSGIRKERRRQLEKMGINPRREYPIAEYLKIVRRYMERKKASP